MAILQRLGNYTRNGLAVVGGIVILSSALSFLAEKSDTRLKAEGKLADGLPYSISTESHYTPGNSFAQKYIIKFKDGVIVEDAFLQGCFGPIDLADARGKRIINEHWKQKGYSGNSYERLRKEVLERVQEVYSQQGIELKVREMD